MQRNGRTEQARSQTKLVAGPWNHPSLGSRQVAGFDFGPQAELDLPGMIIRWFDYWLKEADNGIDREPAVRYFAMAGQGGYWREADTCRRREYDIPCVFVEQRRQCRIWWIRAALSRRWK